MNVCQMFCSIETTHVVKIAMKSTSLSRFVSPVHCEIISRYYRQNCKNSRLFSRNPTFAGEPLGYHQKTQSIALFSCVQRVLNVMPCFSLFIKSIIDERLAR